MPDEPQEDQRTAKVPRGWTDRDAEVLARIAWLLGEGIGVTRCSHLVEAFGGAAAAIEATPTAVAEVLRASLPAGRTWLDAARAARDGDALREVARAREHGIALAMPGDRGFPTLLEVIPDPPPLLWVRGVLGPTAGEVVARGDGCVPRRSAERATIEVGATEAPHDHDEPRVAVVGSRRATAYGLEQAARLAGGLAESGIAVVSGGARGIDAAAHRAAIRVGGRTIAVLGSGLLEPYPPEHARLFESIAEAGGAVISEFPLGQPPRPGLFPRRNRIISGLSLGVVVVEAARRSGSLITARLAVEEHGREAMVVPGRVDAPRSAGCLRAIREGWASMVTSSEEVIESLGEGAAMLLEGAAARRDVAGRRVLPADAPVRAGDRSGVERLEGDAPSRSAAVAQDEADASSDPARAAIRSRLRAAGSRRRLDDPCLIDEICVETGLDASRVLAELTLLRLGR